MTQQTQFNVTNSKLVKLLKKTIKGVIAQQGIKPSTRKGNKELDILIKQIAKKPFTSELEVKNLAQTVGESLIKLSKAQKKIYLDKGIVRQLYLQQDLTISISTSSNEATVQTKEPPKQVEKSTTKPQAETAKITKVEETTSETTEIEEPTTKPQAEAAATTKVEETTAETTEISKEDENESSDQTPKNAVLGLKERLTEDIKLAMKAKDKIRLETVRSIKKVVLEKEVEVRPKGQETLTSEQELEVLAQQAKQRRDSIEQYRQGGRDDLADKEAQELEIIETYLPAQLSEEEIGEVIDNIIASVGASSPKDMGKVMGPAMKELKGKADGKKVQEMVKEKLA